MPANEFMNVKIVKPTCHFSKATVFLCQNTVNQSSKQ